MSTIITTVLTAGVTDSLLAQVGFDGKGGGAFGDMETLNATVDILGGAFANAGLAAIMGEPLNAEQVAAVSTGRIAAELALGGLDISEALANAESSVDAQPTAQWKEAMGRSTEEYFLLDQKQIQAAHAGSHRVRAPGLAVPHQASEHGDAVSVEDAVLEPSSAPLVTAATAIFARIVYGCEASTAEFERGMLV